MVIRKFKSNEELSIFAKKKGFIYQSSEIYGGLSGFYDYGHLGALLKRNYCDEWRHFFLNLGENFVEIDPSIVMAEKVFKASGHLKNFFDPIVIIEGSEETYRADHLIEDNLGMRAEDLSNEEMLNLIIKNELLGEIDYSKVKIENLNMMFMINIGPKKNTKAFLRAETAQGPFVNFKTEYELLRKKLPFGLATIGKAFRNEISPRNLLLRTRELEQAELQIFFNPNRINEHSDFEKFKNYKLRVVFKDSRKEEPKWVVAEEFAKDYPIFYVYHLIQIQRFYFEILKINPENFRLYELNNKEKAFYNKVHFDIEVFFNSVNNWVEVGGCHYRTDHDLGAHEKESKIKHIVFDETAKEKVLPHVLELSFGVGRNVQFFLDYFCEISEEKSFSVVRFPLRLAPYKVAILPLQNDPKIINLAREIFKNLKDERISVIYDKSGGIGRRYVRQDEIGTPFCITIDYNAIEEGSDKGTVTIRNRDTKEQKRIKVSEINNIIRNLVSKKIDFVDLS